MAEFHGKQHATNRDEKVPCWRRPRKLTDLDKTKMARQKAVDEKERLWRLREEEIIQEVEVEMAMEYPDFYSTISSKSTGQKVEEDEEDDLFSMASSLSMECVSLVPASSQELRMSDEEWQKLIKDLTAKAMEENVFATFINNPSFKLIKSEDWRTYPPVLVDGKDKKKEKLTKNEAEAFKRFEKTEQQMWSNLSKGELPWNKHTETHGNYTKVDDRISKAAKEYIDWLISFCGDDLAANFTPEKVSDWFKSAIEGYLAPTIELEVKRVSVNCGDGVSNKQGRPLVSRDNKRSRERAESRPMKEMPIPLPEKTFVPVPKGLLRLLYGKYYLPIRMWWGAFRQTAIPPAQITERVCDELDCKLAEAQAIEYYNKFLENKGYQKPEFMIRVMRLREITKMREEKKL